jgi:hypothetical protein
LDLVLSNLWISVEQLIDFIWDELFIKNKIFHPKKNIEGRKNTLKDDNRTWSATVKQEILFQNGLLDDEILSRLYPARIARNRLVHDGKAVSENIAVKLFEAMKMLLSLASGKKDILSQDITEDNWEIRSEKTDFDSTYFEDWNK